MTEQYTTWAMKDCHKGNSLVWKHPEGGALYIGGWNMGAKFDYNTHIIDLTGTEHKFWDIPFAYDDASKAFMPFLAKSYAGWLSLPFPDFKVPASLNTREQWNGIAATIENILHSGKDVLVACHGGHGRSGLFCAIVGYILGVRTDRSWSSPVEKIRQLHCDGAVETFEQEKFVYSILNLPIQIKHTYTQASEYAVESMKKCPICGTMSYFVGELGMCASCKHKYEELAPVRTDLTVGDIQHKGLVEHSCEREQCVGIWKAARCGHVVHDQIVLDGWCNSCWEKYQEDIEYAEAHDKGQEWNDDADDKEDKWNGKCVICGEHTMYAKRFGVCYDCSEKLVAAKEVDPIHNSITDPYRAVPHHCDEVSCIGVIMADVCGHVIHNREIEDGVCPECEIKSNKKRNKKNKRGKAAQ